MWPSVTWGPVTVQPPLTATLAAPELSTALLPWLQPVPPGGLGRGVVRALGVEGQQSKMCGLPSLAPNSFSKPRFRHPDDYYCVYIRLLR